FLSVEGSESLYKAEEGNLGKLMRIAFSQQTSKALLGYEGLKEEGLRFLTFQGRVLGKGLTAVFREVCFGLRARNVETNEVLSYPTSPTKLGVCELEAGRNLCLWGGIRVQSVLAQADATEGDLVLWLGQKLNWKLYSLTSLGWVQLGSGKK